METFKSQLNELFSIRCRRKEFANIFKRSIMPLVHFELEALDD